MPILSTLSLGAATKSLGGGGSRRRASVGQPSFSDRFKEATGLLEEQARGIPRLNNELLAEIEKSRIQGLSAADPGLASFFGAQRNLAAQAERLTGTTLQDILDSPAFTQSQELRRSAAVRGGRNIRSPVVAEDLSTRFLVDAFNLQNQLIQQGAGLAGQLNFQPSGTRTSAVPEIGGAQTLAGETQFFQGQQLLGLQRRQIRAEESAAKAQGIQGAAQGAGQLLVGIA